MGVLFLMIKAVQERCGHNSETEKRFWRFYEKAKKQLESIGGQAGVWIQFAPELDVGKDC